MCKISIDTVRRANNRTMMQVDKNCDVSLGRASKDCFDVSVSVMGQTYGKSLSSAQIRNSFNKALDYAKKV